MPEKEKPLPQPPSTPFGLRKKFEQQGDGSQLIADQLAMAMAEGKLDEYIKQEMPDNEHARKLTQMMMGMSGMAGMPIPGLEQASEEDTENKPSVNSGGAATSEVKSPAQAPEDLVKAALDGDIKGLMQMLRREHEKTRSATAATSAHLDIRHTQSLDAGQDVQPSIEKEIVEALAAIAGDNSLTMDWLILRALKLYVLEYKKTGRL
jgi:hypothetical protein